MSDTGTGLSLGEVARLTGGRVLGDATRRIRNMAPLDEAGPDDLSMLSQPRYRRMALASTAGALLVKEGFELEGRDQVIVRDPHFALVALLPRLAQPPPAGESGISDRAKVASSAQVGSDVAIGPFAVVGEDCVVGNGARIGSGSRLGARSELGEGSVLHPNTTVYPGCRLGRRVIVHSGTVIGSDGFGYATRDSIHHKVPQVGAVIVEDDVEIGAGVTVDRGSIGNTVIGRGTKIDNLVQIGHNVHIGPGCLVVAQTGISGSTRIGAGTVFAGQSGAAGHLVIGSGVTVASKSAVYDDLPDRSFVAGIPAVDHRRWKRAQALFQRLPELQARIRELEDRLALLEGRHMQDFARAQTRQGVSAAAPRRNVKGISGTGASGLAGSTSRKGPVRAAGIPPKGVTKPKRRAKRGKRK